MRSRALRPVCRGFLELACLTAALGAATHAWAQGVPFTLPSPVKFSHPQAQQLISLPLGMAGKTQQQLAKNGLLLTVDAIGTQGLGYRPLEVTFIALAPAPADRSLTVEFATYRRFGMNEAVRVTEHVDLPAGAASAKATLRLPQYAGWDTFGVNTWEDGEHLEELSFEHMGTGGQQFNESLPRVLVIGPATSDLSGLTAAVGSAQPNPSTGQPFTNSVSLREGAALSDHWLDYTTFDVVVASWDQLDALMHNHPQAWQALRRWVSAGGNLIVYKASDAWEWLTPLEADLPAPGVPRTESPSDGSALPGTAPPSQAWDGTSSNMFLPAAFQMLRTWAKRSGTPAPQTRRGWSVARTLPPGQTTTMAAFNVLSAQVAPTVPPPAAESLIRPWNLGQVIALRADPLTPDPAIWLSVWSQLGDDRIAAAPRLGLSALSPNPDFWNLLVPNVGLPPVDAFRVLITLFVLVIGPVNYFLLRRLQRLHLLVFIVPAAALLVTLSLLGYAILGDGLGVKIRPRTLTVLDPARGEGVCWQRLSYYAGLAPSGGLSFSPETAVYPLVAQPSPYGRGEATRVVVWGEKQNLTRGWLASRTPTQLITLRATSTPASLGVVASASALELTNRLGTDVLQVVVVDDQGRSFHAENLADGKSAVAKEMPLAEAVGKLLPIMGRVRPETPAELIGGGWGAQRSYGFSGFDSPWPDPHQETSRLEQTLEQLSDPGKRSQLPLGSRSFAAIVRRSPLAEYGYEAVEESGELHVVLGRW